MSARDLHAQLTTDTTTLAACQTCGRSLLTILESTGKARCKCGDWIGATE